MRFCQVKSVAIDAKDFKTNCWKETPKEVNDCPTCGRNGIVFSGEDADLLTKEKPDDSPIVLEMEALSSKNPAGIKGSAEIPDYEFYVPHYRGLIMGDESGNFLNIKVM